jgi:hypothetical protein
MKAMSKFNEDPMMEPVGQDHRMELVTVLVSPTLLKYKGVCHCGEASGVFTTAGMVHGWHGTHLQEVLAKLSKP